MKTTMTMIVVLSIVLQAVTVSAAWSTRSISATTVATSSTTMARMALPATLAFRPRQGQQLGWLHRPSTMALQGTKDNNSDNNVDDDSSRNNDNDADVNENKEQTPFTFHDEECYDLCWVDSDEAEILNRGDHDAMHSMDGDDDMEMRSTTVAIDPDAARVRMEMVWQLWKDQESCDVEDVRSCGEQCKACGGLGSTPCRFCKGSKVVELFDGHSVDCPVCQDGYEVCKACQGSGWVAGWTTLSESV